MNLVFDDPERAERFEEEDLNLISDCMEELAKGLSIMPKNCSAISLITGFASKMIPRSLELEADGVHIVLRSEKGNVRMLGE